METNKAIEIYLPNNTDSLNKDLLEKQSAISKILKGTPFEKDTNAIFEHLVRVQGALHITESNMQSRKEHLKEELNIIKTLILLNSTPESMTIKCSDVMVTLPNAIVMDIALRIRESTIKLFNQSPYLFVSKDKDNNSQILNPNNLEHLYQKESELNKQLKELNTRREKAGKATYTQETPNKVTDTFRMLCAIKGFCKCDGFNGWGKRGNAKKNRCIFECLQVFGYTTIKKNTDAMEKADQRNYEKNRVIAAERSNIVFISPPL